MRRERMRCLARRDPARAAGLGLPRRAARSPCLVQRAGAPGRMPVPASPRAASPRGAHRGAGPPPTDSIHGRVRSRESPLRPPLERASLFTFTSTRATGLRFESGHFVMVGLDVDGRPLLRAYSIASAALGGAPRVLQHQGAERPADLAPAAPQVGDDVLVGRKPTGTLVTHRPAARPLPLPASRPAPAWRRS